MATPTISFSGLVSGIDFNSIIQATVTQQRIAFEQPLQDQKTALSLRNSMYSEIQSALNALQTSVNNLLNTTQMQGYAAATSDSTVLKASAGNGAAAGTYTVTVKQMASATQVTSSFVSQVPPILGLGGRAAPTQTLNSTAAKMRVAVTAGAFTVNGTQITVDPTTDTVNSVLAKINAATGITASYDSTNDVMNLSSTSSIALGAAGDTSNFLAATNLLASPQSFSSPNYTRTSTTHLGAVQTTTLLANANFQTPVTGDGTGAGSFTINGVTINYNINTDALQDVINRINQQAPTVIASYDSTSDRLVLLSKTTGSIAISRQDVTGNFLNATGLLDSGSVSRAQQTLGNNAQVVVNGFNNNQPITSNSNTISNIIPGVSLSLVNSSPLQSIQVTVTPDAQALTNAVNDFASKYNGVLSLVSQRLTEKPLQNPMTDAQREVGLLNGDALLMRIKYALISNESGAVTGLPVSLRQLSQIGVALSSANTGEVTVNGATLSQALSNNRDAAYHVLFNDVNGNGVVDTGEDGVAVRLQNTLTQILSTTTQVVGGSSTPAGWLPAQQNGLNTRISQIDQRVTDFETNLSGVEDRLRQSFTVMEQRLAALQSQSAGLASLGVNVSSFFNRQA